MAMAAGHGAQQSQVANAAATLIVSGEYIFNDVPTTDRLQSRLCGRSQSMGTWVKCGDPVGQRAVDLVQGHAESTVGRLGQSVDQVMLMNPRSKRSQVNRYKSKPLSDDFGRDCYPLS